MIDLVKYNNEPEFQTALKEMFSSLDPKVLNKVLVVTLNHICL